MASDNTDMINQGKYGAEYGTTFLQNKLRLLSKDYAITKLLVWKTLWLK